MSLLIKYNKFTTRKKHLQPQSIFFFLSFVFFWLVCLVFFFSYFGKNYYLNGIFKQAQSKINLKDAFLTDNWNCEWSQLAFVDTSC